MKRKTGLFLSFSTCLDIPSRCFSWEAYFVCFLSVVSLFTGTALNSLQRTLVFWQESPQVNMENIITSCLMNLSIEMTILLKNQYTERKRLWRLSGELRKTDQFGVAGFTEKKQLSNRFQLFLREHICLHTQLSKFLILCVPINQIIIMDNHKQKQKQVIFLLPLIVFPHNSTSKLSNLETPKPLMLQAMCTRVFFLRTKHMSKVHVNKV